MQGYDVGKVSYTCYSILPSMPASPRPVRLVSQRLSASASAVGEPGSRFGFGVAIPRSARGNSVTLGNYLANGGSVVFVGNVLFTYIYLHTVVE